MEQRLGLGNLLYDDGNLAEEGYAFSLVKKYNRSLIKAHKNRIKEVESYLFLNDKFALTFEILDLAYANYLNVYFVEFETKKTIFKTYKNVLGRSKLSPTAFGDINFKTKAVHFEALDSGNKKRIKANLTKFDGESDFRCDIFLNENFYSSIVNAKAFEGFDKHFIYTLKKNLLNANGYFKIGSKTYDFDASSFATYKWGRGVLPRLNEYVWANMSTKIKDQLIGFNFGYGLGNDKYSSENILYIGKQTFKFENIHIDVPISKKGTDEYKDVWKIRSDDGMVDLSFTPIIYSPLKQLSMKMLIDKNRVYGKYKGSIIVNNERIVFDDVIGIAEKNICRW